MCQVQHSKCRGAVMEDYKFRFVAFSRAKLVWLPLLLFLSGCWLLQEEVFVVPEGFRGTAVVVFGCSESASASEVSGPYKLGEEGILLLSSEPREGGLLRGRVNRKFFSESNDGRREILPYRSGTSGLQAYWLALASRKLPSGVINKIIIFDVGEPSKQPGDANARRDEVVKRALARCSNRETNGD